MVSTGGIDRWYRPVVSTNGIDRWYRPMVSTNGIDRWYRPMVSTDDIDRWYRPVVSTNGIDRWYRPVVSTNGIDRWYRPVVSTGAIDRWYRPVVSTGGIDRWYRPVVTVVTGTRRGDMTHTPHATLLPPPSSPRGLRLKEYRGFTGIPLVFSRYCSTRSVMVSPPSGDRVTAFCMAYLSRAWGAGSSGFRVQGLRVRD